MIAALDGTAWVMLYVLLCAVWSLGYATAALTRDRGRPR